MKGMGWDLDDAQLFCDIGGWGGRLIKSTKYFNIQKKFLNIRVIKNT